MTGRYLAYLNILVYAYDRSEPEKHARALETLDMLARDGFFRDVGSQSALPCIQARSRNKATQEPAPSISLCRSAFIFPAS